MPVELRLLVWSAALAVVQVVIAVIAARSQVGLFALVSNRGEMPALSGVALRAERAHLNLLESLVPFAIGVVAACVTDRLNSTTALGAMLFFWGRAFYAPVYVIGIPVVRTILWAVSIVGMLLVLVPLL